ncbi:MAG TPA: BTAD domain-containing putative transcriptional regulator [Conexibacter sp.]|jgi:predicted ATPase/DNA-binding SARP family transcriptional activator
MEFRILGPLEVCAEGHAVALGGAKPRAALALLALNANRPVSAERLALALWGEDAPAGAVNTVQVHVSRLRKALADPDVLVTTPAGYCLRVDPGDLDADRFERQLAIAREALAAGRAEFAGDLLREALALWRGAPLAECAWAPFAPPEIDRLEELHLTAVEVRVDADLAAGRHAELVAELQRLTSRHPWRERLHAQLMLAMYRSGRQADALRSYRRAREVLVEQMGIEPGRELQELHQAMLVHDPALEPPRVAITPAGDRRSALPAPPNRTIGREREISLVSERLRTGSVRLLTLTGPGGVGKTRLALEAARRVEPDFADGARFVSLAAVQRPQDVAAAIVESLRIIALSGESPEEAVERFLADKNLLLVIDNCEHLLGAARFIAGVPAACPAVTVLATSREQLAVHAEQRHPVAPLALPAAGTPDHPEALEGVNAVALFCERARAHDSGFYVDEHNAPAVAEICRRVDGVPLAIELAAARCGLLSPDEIAERLDATLGALGVGARDAPARQRTLRATIDWSHELLNDDEKACFAPFAVFAGGATVHAAEAITGASIDTLDRLVAKNLLVGRHAGHGRTRLAMLETIRLYAAERLACTADRGDVHERHCRYYLALAQRHGTEPALGGQTRDRDLAALDADSNNLEAALRWAIANSSPDVALALVIGLGRYWLLRHRYAHAVSWMDKALDKPSTDTHKALRARALLVKDQFMWPLGREDERASIVDEAAALAGEVGDPELISRAFQSLAHVSVRTGRSPAASALAEQAIEWAIRAGDPWEIALAHYEHALAAPTIAELRVRVQRAASMLHDVGNIFQLAGLLTSAAYEAICKASDRDALEYLARAETITRMLEDPYMLMLIRGNAGLAALFTGDIDAARGAFCEELRLCREMVILSAAHEPLRGLAAVAAAEDDLPRAARLNGAAAAHRYADPPDPVDARLLAGFFEPARARQGARAWDADIRGGAALNFNDAIAYALEEPS